MARHRRVLPEDYFEIFPSRLREEMKEQNVTQQKLADYIGLSRQAVAAYCDGTSTPDWKTLAKIAQFLNVPTDYLVGLSGVASVNLDIQSACHFTGLTKETVQKLHGLSDDELSVLNLLVMHDQFSDFLSKSLEIISLTTEYTDRKATTKLYCEQNDCEPTTMAIDFVSRFFAQRQQEMNNQKTTPVPMQASDPILLDNGLFFLYQENMIRKLQHDVSDMLKTILDEIGGM